MCAGSSPPGLPSTLPPGLGLLIQFAERLAETRQRFVVVAAPGTFPRRILEIIAADQKFTLSSSEEEAVASLIP